MKCIYEPALTEMKIHIKNVWSNVSNGCEELLKTLNMNTKKVPALEDMELNLDVFLSEK